MRSLLTFRGNCLGRWRQILSLIFLIAVANSGIAATPLLEKADVFQAGEKGINLYRIPGIVVTTHGTVLVYCEARRNSKSDWADSEVFLRRSTNGGLTFDAARKIAHFGKRLTRSPIALARKEGSAADQTVNNPVAIVDRITGAVHFIYCVNYERCFYLRSDDDGVTFSKPIDITSAFDKFRPEYDCRVIATGPGHGVQLKNGRLLIPVWLSTGDKGHSPSVAATIFSDDHGRTWSRGAIALPSSDEWPNPNETAAVELSDGGVMLNVRTGASANRRVVTTSPDGITNWTTGHFDEALLEPICMASLVRYSVSPPADKNRILFSNPDNLKGGKEAEKPGSHRDRKNLSIKLSYDEGKTWAVNKALEAGPSAYSDLAVLPDGTILCFYERPQRLVLARFNLEWLTDGKDSGNSSPGFMWQKLPAIPDAEGFAGSFVGTSGGALVVAGGANTTGDKWGTTFQKKWYDSVFILEQPTGTWRSDFKLPHALGYGVSVTTADGVICIGGSDASLHYADVFRLSWSEGKLKVVSLPSLPKACANCCGALVGNAVYVAGGIESPAATSAMKNFWCLDLKEEKLRWVELEPWPGPERMLAVSGAYDGSFFLISGVALKPNAAGEAVREYLRDAYAFTPGKGWRRLADLPQAVAAAPSPAATSAGGLLIFSGDDGTQVNRPPSPAHPGFSHSVIAYDARENEWSTVGVLPFSRATTGTAEWRGQVVVPMGEARPRERTPDVWWAKLPNSPVAKTGAR